ncbi:hypothetical protein ACMGDM_20385 [Sphingomonas sp. DT-51]|uniref:hypothetical protein n=1 Tax=Sphingomonas sp. DT-51 TaxID=3396165 RepID=UPI003F1B5E53
MLESYDPKAAEKYETWAQEYRAIIAKPFPLPHETARANALGCAMREAVGAEYADPNRYVRWQLSLTLKEADQLGIWAWLPTLPDHAGIDAARVAIAEVVTYIDTVKHRRETFEVCRRAGMTPTYVCPLPRLTWRTRLAMLRFRLGREWRCWRYQPLLGS